MKTLSVLAILRLCPPGSLATPFPFRSSQPQSCHQTECTSLHSCSFFVFICLQSDAAGAKATAHPPAWRRWRHWLKPDVWCRHTGGFDQEDNQSPQQEDETRPSGVSVRAGGRSGGRACWRHFFIFIISGHLCQNTLPRIRFQARSVSSCHSARSYFVICVFVCFEMYQLVKVSCDCRAEMRKPPWILSWGTPSSSGRRCLAACWTLTGSPERCVTSALPVFHPQRSSRWSDDGASRFRSELATMD